jgi:hypothetical protein
VPVRLAYGGDVPGYADDEIALAAAGAEPPPTQPHGDDLLYSNGTAGRPKGIKQPLPQIAVDEPGYLYPTVFGKLYGFQQDPFKVRQGFHFRDDLPRTPTGKMVKGRLRELYDRLEAGPRA